MCNNATSSVLLYCVIMELPKIRVSQLRLDTPASHHCLKNGLTISLSRETQDNITVIAISRPCTYKHILWPTIPTVLPWTVHTLTRFGGCISSTLSNTWLPLDCSSSGWRSSLHRMVAMMATAASIWSITCNWSSRAVCMEVTKFDEHYYCSKSDKMWLTTFTGAIPSVQPMPLHQSVYLYLLVCVCLSFLYLFSLPV